MDSPRDLDTHATRHRGGVLLARYGLDLYLHPYLTYSLPRGHRSPSINIDEMGFRLSESPFGSVDSANWAAAGGGGLVVGNSVAIGLGASSDGGSVPSRLAFLTGVRQLNAGTCASTSLQELVAAVPFLHAARTVVIVSGGNDVANHLYSRTPFAPFPQISYESAYDKVSAIPMYDLADLTDGKEPSQEMTRRPAVERLPWGTDDIEQRIDTALAHRLRDIGIVTRAVSDDTRVLFCLQPLATARTRTLTAEEEARYPFHAPTLGLLHSVIEDKAEACAAKLAAGCAGLGAGFLNLAADKFTGSVFLDNVHLNDDGYQQAARMIHEALADTPPTGETRAR
jgi:lysophospholipase L1-like esterase